MRKNIANQLFLSKVQFRKQLYTTYLLSNKNLARYLIHFFKVHRSELTKMHFCSKSVSDIFFNALNYVQKLEHKKDHKDFIKKIR